MKKTLALALAVMMLCVCALTVSAAETTLPDVTFGGWWTAHSQGVQITEEGFTMTFTADTEDGAALNYCVPTLVIHAGAADAVGAEYWCQRADAWGWLYGENVGDHADALHAKGYSWNFVFEDSFISWENFQATTEAGTQATVTAKLEGSNVQLTYKLAGVINEVTIPVDAANPVYLCITGERCAASNIVVTTPEEETQPTEPETQPTEPETQPTEPETQPTEPETQPTEPETQPTEPSIPETEATQPEATEPATKPANPGTGDNSPVMLAAVMMMAAACLIVLVQKKRAF